MANSAEGHEELVSIIRQQPAPVQIGFEATGGQEWALWTMLVAADIDARQLPPAQIKAFAKSKGTRAKTGRIDAELIAQFMQFRPGAGRRLPNEKLRILRTLTTRRAQAVDIRKQLAMQVAARRKQGVAGDIEGMDNDLKALLDSQIRDMKRQIEVAIAQDDRSEEKARLLLSVPGIGSVSAALLIAEMPELGRMTAGEAGHC